MLFRSSKASWDNESENYLVIRRWLVSEARILAVILITLPNIKQQLSGCLNFRDVTNLSVLWLTRVDYINGLLQIIHPCGAVYPRRDIPALI